MNDVGQHRGKKQLAAAGCREVTVCIVTYRRDDKLLECLGKLVQSTLQPAQVRITLPKFEFETEFTLSDALKELGMVIPFNGGADFSGMLPGGGLFIDEAFHKTFIAVEEGGAEAAAATAVVVGETSVPVEDAAFAATSPFYFAIRDRDTGLVLFFGRVMNPAE
jgi:serpin B